MQEGEKEFLCKIVGIQRVNKKEFKLLLNPQITGVEFVIPQTVEEEYHFAKRNTGWYLSVSIEEKDIEPVEDIRTLQLKKEKKIFYTSLQEKNGGEIRVKGFLLSGETLLLIQKNIGNLWERVIQNSIALLNHKEAYRFVWNYLKCVMREEPTTLSNERRRGVGNMECVAYAIQKQFEQVQLETLADLRAPTTFELENWLCFHTITAIEKNAVFLKKGKVIFDIGKMMKSYFESCA